MVQSRKFFSLYTFLIFLMVYCSHDTLLFGTNAVQAFIVCRKIIPFILILLLCLLQRIETLNMQDIIVGVIFLALPIVSCIVHNEALNNYIYRFAIMFCAIILVLSSHGNEFANSYNAILYFLSMWSCVFFLIGNILPFIMRIFPIIKNSVGVEYHFTGFSVVPISYTLNIRRNYGIFREPGVYMIFLSIALFFELVLNEKVNFKRIAVYSITMLTTLSTAGYLVLIGMYGYLLIFKRKTKQKNKYIFFSLSLVLFLSALTSSQGILEGIFEKFDKGNNSYGSWFARISSFTQNLSITLKNPLFGVGRYALYEMILATSGIYMAQDNTNTILIGFAAYGILFGVLTLIGMWCFIQKRVSNIWGCLIWLIILCMAFSNEDMGQNFIYYIIVFQGLFKVKNREGSRVDAL